MLNSLLFLSFWHPTIPKRSSRPTYMSRLSHVSCAHRHCGSIAFATYSLDVVMKDSEAPEPLCLCTQTKASIHPILATEVFSARRLFCCFESSTCRKTTARRSLGQRKIAS